jgi:hypothetical protein
MVLHCCRSSYQTRENVRSQSGHAVANLGPILQNSIRNLQRFVKTILQSFISAENLSDKFSSSNSGHIFTQKSHLCISLRIIGKNVEFLSYFTAIESYKNGFIRKFWPKRFHKIDPWSQSDAGRPVKFYVVQSLDKFTVVNNCLCNEKSLLQRTVLGHGKRIKNLTGLPILT